MIARNWRGTARPEEADNYIAHLKQETFPQLAKIDGFLYASILQRPNASGVEFLIVTTWQSMEAIRQFAGEQAHIAVVPDVLQAMMLDYDREVAHFEVVEIDKPE
jgi:heme-degrading monooxygenase HmoA